MVNTNIQGPIPLAGKGFVAKNNNTRDYAPGEYRRLNNAEIIEDKIVRRRDIRNVGAVGGFTTSAFGYHQAIGELGDYVIYAGPNAQRACSVDKTVNMFDPLDGLGTADAVAPTDSPIAKLLIGVFKYNNTNYWLYGVVEQNDSVTPTYSRTKFILIYCGESVLDDPADYTARSFSPESRSTLLTFNFETVGPEYSNIKFNNSFVHKDRLWLCLNDGIYFSKAADLTEFDAVDGGGFFKFPDDKVNWAVALKDTIYVFCDTKVYLVTYDTDPNTDPVVRTISDNIGGENAVVFRDAPIFINKEGIFSVVNNSYVQKLMDSDLDEGTNNFSSQKLTVFDEYVVVNKTRYDTVANVPEYRFNVMRDQNNDLGYVKNWDIGSNTTLSNNGAQIRMTCNTIGITIGMSMLPVGVGAPNIPVRAGKSYCLHHDVRCSVAAPNAKMFYQIYFYDASFAVLNGGVPYTPDDVGSIPTAGYPWGTPDVNLTNVTQHPTIMFVAPKNAAYVRVVTRAQKNAGNWAVSDYVETTAWHIEESTVPIATKITAQVQQDDYLYGVDSGNAAGAQRALIYPYLKFNTLVRKTFVPNLDNNVLGYNTYFINMDTGAVHTITLPTVTSPVGDINGRIVDCYTIESNKEKGSRLYFMTKDAASDYSRFLYMGAERTTEVYDSSYNGAALTRYAPPITVEIDSFSPDGSEHMMKKFRSIELQGMFPKTAFRVAMALDNQAYGAEIALIDDTAGVPEARPHYTHRIGINARGRAISLRFTTDNTNPLGGAEVWSEFEISDLRLLWSYLGRGPNTKNYSQSP